MMEHVDDHHIVILLKQMFLFLVCVAPKCCPLAYRQVGMGGSSSGGVIKDLIDGAASLPKQSSGNTSCNIHKKFGIW